MPTLDNAKHEAFCQRYLVDFNGSESAKDVGYSKKTAPQQATRLLKNVKVQARLAELLKAARKRHEVSQDRVIEEYRRIAFADLRDLFTWDEEKACYVPSGDLTDEQAAAVQSVKAKTTHRTIRGRGDEDEQETEIHLEMKTYDKLRALNDLARHLGMFGPTGSKEDPQHHAIQIHRVNTPPPPERLDD